jgi:hypothetical protein
MASAVIAAAFQDQITLMVAKDGGANSASLAACCGVAKQNSFTILGAPGLGGRKCVLHMVCPRDRRRSMGMDVAEVTPRSVPWAP